MTSTEPPASWSAAIDVTRQLIDGGLPVFAAPPNPQYQQAQKGEPEFLLPRAWQNLEPDTAELARWEPGWALCLVTGRGLDVVDVDPVNGGDPDAQLEGLGRSGVDLVGAVSTPSGGAHFYLPSTGRASSANTNIGVDYRGGRRNGTGRGFVYLPGTQRPKYTGDGYGWMTEPDLSRLPALDRAAQERAITVYLGTLGRSSDWSDRTPEAESGSEAVEFDSLPEWLQALLTDFGPEFTLADGSTSRDRSARFYNVVAACHRAGLSEGQMLTLVTEWARQVA